MITTLVLIASHTATAAVAIIITKRWTVRSLSRHWGTGESE